jgi:hypothetical protein
MSATSSSATKQPVDAGSFRARRVVSRGRGDRAEERLAFVVRQCSYVVTLVGVSTFWLKRSSDFPLEGAPFSTV